MSQYPQYPQYPPQTPYGGPYAYYPQYGDPRAGGPGRRAFVMMLILGVLGLAVAASCLSLPALVNWGVNHPQMPPAQKLDLQQKLAEAERSGVSLKQIAWVYTGLVGAPMLLLLVLAPFVRRGSVAAGWIAIVVTGLIVLGSLGGILLMLVAGAQGLPGACVFVVIGALFILQLVWLIGAVRGGPAVPQPFPPGYGPPMPGYYAGGGYTPYGGYPGYGPPLPPPPGQGPVGQPPASAPPAPPSQPQTPPPPEDRRE